MSREFKYDVSKMRKEIRKQGRRSRNKRRSEGSFKQTSLTPRKCPKCGSDKIVRKVKDTFQYDGFTCLDCLEHIPEEGGS